jgi:hypothetical protein
MAEADAGIAEGGADAGGGAHVAERAAERVWGKRLKTFSGRKPVPHSEHDHESWDFYATQFIQLLENNDVEESLCQPALGVARNLGREVAPENIVEVVKIAYGSTADGHGHGFARR